MKMRIFHRGLILVGVPFMLELILAGSLSALLYQSAQERQAETKYRKYASEIANLMSYLSSAPLTIALSVQFRNDKMFVEYTKQAKEIQDTLHRLQATMSDIPEIPRKEYPILASSVGSILRMTDSLAFHRDDIATGNMPLDALQSFQSSLADAKKVVALHLDEMFNLSDQLLAKAEKRLDNTRSQQMKILWMVFGLNLGMAVALGVFYRHGIVNRIRTIARNTEALTRSEKLAPEISGSDEIAQFDRAFHSMLEQLAKAAQNEQELFENASDVICILDNDNRFERINPASLKDWGIPPEQLIGKPLGEILSEDDSLLVNASIQEARTTRGAISFEAKVKLSESCQKVGLWSIYWSEEERKLFCIVHDVSERKLIETAKKQFLTMISADLKIPLARVASGLNKLPELSSATITEQGKDRLEMARKAVDRLLALVNDLLQVAQMESGQIEVNPVVASMQDLFQRARADVEPLAQAKNLKIEILPGDAQCFVDPDRIIQVLVNLLSNAIKFSPEGKVVTFSAEASKQQLICRVADQGRGVPSSHRTAIFEKFSQVEKQDGKRKAGTGLGLPICKEIIEKHGGKIAVESKEGEGSTFWFTVPATPQSSIAESAPSPAQPQTPTDAVVTAPVVTPALPALKAPIGTSLPLNSKGVVLVGIPVIFELIVVAILSNSLLDLQRERSTELTFRRMAVEASKVSKAVLYASSVVTDQSDKFAWDQLQLCYREWTEAQRELEKLCYDDAYTKREFEKYLAYSKKMKLYRDSLMKQRFGPESDIAQSLSQKLRFLPTAVALTTRLRNIIQFAKSKEFQTPEKDLQRLQFQFALLAGAVALNVSVSFALAMFFSLGISRRILIMADNAERLAGEEKLNPIMPGNDELAELDRSFHKTAALLAEARRKERAVFDNSKDVLCIISPNAGFLSVNSAVESSWGYPKKELLDISLRELVVPEDFDKTKTSLLGEIDPSSGSRVECRILKKDGSSSHVLLAASRKPGQENTFCVVHDIEDRVALELLRKDFLAMVSHDMRSPLTAVNGVTQLMQTGVFGKVSSDTASCLKGIKTNVDSLLELIGDILDLEKMDAGMMELSKEPTRVTDITYEVEKQIESVNGKINIENKLEQTDISLEVDRDRVLQSLGNLAKFLFLRAKQSITLKIIQSVNSIEFVFTDSGPALSENDCKQLFERVKEPSASPILYVDLPFHADLVLPLAAKTIESHGGTISACSLQTGCNEICISLPSRSTILV